MSDNTKKIRDLKFDDQFKFMPTQRKWRKFMKLVELKGDRIPAEHKGKWLLIDVNCRQTIVDPLDDIIIP